MRSFLTVLGVIIGTGAVIGVGSIIAGLDGAITNLLRSFGPNTVIVLKGKAMGNWTREEQRRKPLTLENARAIAERCPSVEHVSPYIFPMSGMHTRALQGQRHLQYRYGRHRRRLRRRRHHHEIRPLLHRYREHASAAGGGDRRRRAKAVAPERGSDRQMHRGGRPLHARSGRDGPAGRGAAGPERHPHPDPVLHHAQDVPQPAENTCSS